MTLTEFLLARIAEDEEAAQDAAGWRRDGRTRSTGRWDRYGVASVDGDEGQRVVYSDADQVSPSVADHIARFDPARVLAVCKAHRRIVELHRAFAPPHGFAKVHIETLAALAAVYSDHPDYREEWRA